MSDLDQVRKWYVYMLECADGSIYTGITNNLEARINKHNSGCGAKYTKGRNPVILKRTGEYENRSLASKVEYGFKRLSREQKLNLINNS